MSIPTQIGRYEVLGLLGTGGMAEVFLGRVVGPAGFKRPLVIKRILPHLARQQSFVDMFLDEARIVARIRHGNVVQVQELCQEGDQLYLVMEYLEGESLDGVVRRLISHRRLLEYGLAAHIIAEVAGGLHAAHELTDEHGTALNLVHRDVSPANIFVCYDGQVKILDFGIATAADRVSRTSAGQVKGKYPYMSPEQTRGYSLDRRSDIFSLGIVLFELTTCRRLFKRPTEVETAAAIASGEVPQPSSFVPGYPPELEGIINKALSIDPGQRHRTGQEMRRELLEVVQKDQKGPDIGERLGVVMQRLFEDRIGEKRAMLRKVAAGEHVTAVPAADIDDSVVVPDAKFRATPSSPSVIGAAALAEPPPAPLAPSPRRLGASITGSLAVAGILTAAAMAFIGLRGEPPAAETSVAEPAKKTTVELEVITEPGGAKVAIDGQFVGATPLVLKLDRGTGSSKLQIDHPGFKGHTEQITPDRDQRVRLNLVPVPKDAQREAHKEPAKEASKDPAKQAPKEPGTDAPKEPAKDAAKEVGAEVAPKERPKPAAVSTPAPVPAVAQPPAKKPYRKFD